MREIGACKEILGVLGETGLEMARNCYRVFLRVHSPAEITGASVPRHGGKMNFLQGSIRLKNLGDKSHVVIFGYFGLR